MIPLFLVDEKINIEICDEDIMTEVDYNYETEAYIKRSRLGISRTNKISLRRVGDHERRILSSMIFV